MTSEMRVRCCGQNEWGGRCTRDAVEGLTQCGPHRAGQKRREENQAKRDQKWDQQKAFRCRQNAQAAFVEAWRERNPRGSWADPWRCPLCGFTVQTIVEQAPYLTHDIEEHTTQHGQDWLDYQQAGQGKVDDLERRTLERLGEEE